MTDISELEKLQVQVSLLKTLVTTLCALQKPMKADIEVSLFRAITDNVRAQLGNDPDAAALLAHFDEERESLIEVLELRG